MALASGFSLALSFLLRYWGLQHPESFEIRSDFVFILLFGPSLVAFFWILWAGFIKFQTSINHE